MHKFHSLIVSSIKPLTTDSVAISFDTTNNDLFQFVSGQYITIKHQIDGEEVRRAYSICSANTEDVTIGVKRVENGKMSTFLTKDVKVGDALEIMPPSGNFVVKSDPNHIVGICAGSGVTPIISILKTELAKDNSNKFTLIYGNQTQDSAMFSGQLKKLQEETPTRLKIHWVYSREQVAGTINGRIDKNTLQQLINISPSLKSAEAYFICGPGEFIDNANDLLLLNKINQNKINIEHFTSVIKEDINNDNNSDEIIANVMVTVDGEDFEFTLSNKGKTILDAAMEQGADVPFSCKGAVCCTCKAKVMEGKVIMDQNFALSDEEVAEGYVLGCQSHPTSENVVIDFDEM